jgi:hypothetical protein
LHMLFPLSRSLVSLTSPHPELHIPALSVSIPGAPGHGGHCQFGGEFTWIPGSDVKDGSALVC